MRTGIGRAFKTRLPFGKFSDTIVTTGPQRFYQNWGSGGRVLDHMGYCYAITGVSGVVNSRLYKF